MLESIVMSERSYYTDSYTDTFAATVREQHEDPAGVRLVLDHTYFYPTSGGQPNDTGTIDGIPVQDVAIREEDGAIVHLLDRAPNQMAVTAVVDWERRFDHMQQHTGQHILSQSFIQVADAETIGFHLSDETVTIDLDAANLDLEAIKQAELLANRIVWQDRPVIVRWASRAEAVNLPLRKIPDNGNDRLRLIDIMEFDLTACGGTHVARTGEVGLVKVVRQEARGGKTRVEFRCGARALAHYRSLNEVVRELTGLLTTGTVELATSITKLQETEKETRRTMNRLQSELDALQTQQLRQDGRRVGNYTLVVHVFENESAKRLRALASLLAAEDGTVALLGSTGERTHLAFGRAPEAPGAMNELLQDVLHKLGAGSGGGNSSLAQGAGPQVDEQLLNRVFAEVANKLLEEMRAIG